MILNAKVKGTDMTHIQNDIHDFVCMGVLYVVAGIEPRASHMKGKHSTPEVHPQPTAHFWLTQNLTTSNLLLTRGLTGNSQ